MKKMMLLFVALFTLATTSQAMSYEQAREQALFLTDKMAYELNLTDEQYEAAYEINLDYLMSVASYDDLYGDYWRQRNLDLSYILLDWQYRSYCAAAYFYRPLYYSGGYWRFAVYSRYPRRDYFYFGRSTFYTVYRGSHSWRLNGGRSWYVNRGSYYRPGRQYRGMRDNYNRGNYNRGNHYGNRGYEGRYNNGRGHGYGNRDNRRYDDRWNEGRSNSNRSFGSRGGSYDSYPRSSTRANGGMPSTGRSFGSRDTTPSEAPARTFTPESSGTRRFGSSSYGAPTNAPASAPSRTFENTPRSNGNAGGFGGNRPSNGGGGHFGSRR